jgi:hypothetical protein
MPKTEKRIQISEIRKPSSCLDRWPNIRNSKSQTRKANAENRMAGWLAGWLVGWLSGWLDRWPGGWLAGWLVGWLNGWLAAGWLDRWPVCEKN